MVGLHRRISKSIAIPFPTASKRFESSQPCFFISLAVSRELISSSSSDSQAGPRFPEQIIRSSDLVLDLLLTLSSVSFFLFFVSKASQESCAEIHPSLPRSFPSERRIACLAQYPNPKGSLSYRRKGFRTVGTPKGGVTGLGDTCHPLAHYVHHCPQEREGKSYPASSSTSFCC